MAPHGWLQNDGRFLGTLDIRCGSIVGIQREHTFDNHPYTPNNIAVSMSFFSSF